MSVTLYNLTYKIVKYFTWLLVTTATVNSLKLMDGIQNTLIKLRQSFFCDDYARTMVDVQYNIRYIVTDFDKPQVAFIRF